MIYGDLLEENVYKIKNTDILLVGFQSNQDNRQSSKKNKYQFLYTYGCTSWWWT